jgi:hypothetical protein
MTPVPAPADGGASDLTRYRCLDYTAYYAGNDFQLIGSDVTGVRQVLPSISVPLLKACDRFRTLDEHARVICQVEPFREVPVEAVRELLFGLVSMGLLISHEDLAERLGQIVGPEAPPTISVVGVLTCNRPSALRRVASTTLENASRHGRRVELVVVDDSDEEHQQANLAVLHELKDRYGIDVWYAGRAEKAAFARALAEHCAIPLATLNVALTRPAGWPAAPGANRNAMLLHTVGDALLSLDDDMVCTVAQVPGCDDGLALSSIDDPTEFWYFPDPEATLRASALVDEDFLGLHESLLGRNVGKLAAERRPDLPFDLNTIETHFLKNLEPDGGQVTYTMAGILGDTGMGGALALYFSEGPSLDRLLQAEGGYRAALSSRQVARGVARRTVSDASFCMAGNLGLDNRVLLPPFPTIGRGEDDLFGTLVRRCIPGSHIGFLPRTILHDPIVARNSPHDNFDDVVGQIGVPDAMQSLIDFHPGPLGRSTARRRHISMGEYLIDLGSLPTAAIGERLRDLRLSRTSADATLIEKSRRAQRPSNPETWLADLEQYQAALLSILELDPPVTLIERGDDPPEVALTAFAEYMRDFGRLLCAWPDLVEGARELRQQGRRLGRRLP